ncbi:MAG TPA: hypothetical protein VFA37_04150 [Gaiellaceae bacterium]|nr:hypothetical protein [Gaiellaceae bacterium]
MSLALQDEIAKLLNTPEDGAGAPSLATLEQRLTDGYAEALQLEAERLRIERRLREVDSELARLRPLLHSLQARVRARRSAAA